MFIAVELIRVSQIMLKNAVKAKTKSSEQKKKQFFKLIFEYILHITR